MSPHPDSYNRNKGARGFTLIEVLVALALLTVGLVPAFILANSAVILAGSVRNNLVAANLAQEGVEVVRAIRDANWLGGRAYSEGLTTGSPDCTGGCRVEWNSDDVLLPPGTLVAPGNIQLKVNPATGLYQYSGPNDSGFTRQVVVTDVSDHQLKVIVTVGWRERSGDKQYVLEYRLYDWIQ